MAGDAGRCSQCNREGTTKRCSDCGVAKYCGKECQRLNWKIHKRECTKTKQRQPTSSGFEWDQSAWEHSPPLISNFNKIAKCTQGETSVVSVDPFLGEHRESVAVVLVWTVDAIPSNPMAFGFICPSVGVCTRSKKGVLTWWKYRSDGTICSSKNLGLRQYGTTFSSGDAIKVEFKKGSLSFSVNGESQGEAFSQEEFPSDEGPFYLRVHLVNPLNWFFIPTDLALRTSATIVSS
eukprot:GHVN01008669.1.p1 GENE.GHVN01008669.1~~GHVN01008669.1.p1  ORF type:complete len:242 (+),score=12.39 GHVN01008669.1:22-726(+)